MKPKFLVLGITIASLVATNGNAQGWLGASGTDLVGQTSGGNPLSSLRVGIGTTTPAAMLHTNGSLRFAGLGNDNTQTRVLVTNTTGDVYWRDATTIGGGSGWQLTGNSIGSTDFFGTTNNDHIRIRTNNTQKAIITSAGVAAIADDFTYLSNYKLIVNSGTNPSSTTGQDAHVLLTGSGPSLKLCNTITPTTSSKIGGIGLVTIGNQYYPGSAIGDLVVHNYGTNMPIVFATNTGTGSTYSTSNVVSRMRVEPVDGFVGVNTDNGTNPTTDRFHVSLLEGETVRFDLLPENENTVVVIDDDGRLWRSRVHSQEMVGMKAEVSTLREELNLLREQLKNSQPAPSHMLEQNTPNPFANATQINYSIYKQYRSAQIRVSDMNGRTVKEFALEQALGSVKFETADPGNYFYSLVIDGQLVESKKMVAIGK